MVMGGFAITWIGFTFIKFPAILLIPMCIFGGALVGAMWAAIPGYLKARRGVHEVVTTIMECHRHRFSEKQFTEHCRVTGHMRGYFCGLSFKAHQNRV
jgi:hypothetical protein